MSPILPFTTLFLASVVMGRLRRFPLLLSVVEAAAFAGGITLVFFAEEIELAYRLKAMLIVLCVLVSFWAWDRMVRAGRRRDHGPAPGDAAVTRNQP